MKHIRNFSIIAHIDHGKSTLADRMLEITGTIEARQMRDQVLDSMDLERERGITIKMQPVRMDWQQGDTTYQLNLIDTPGHIDFSYEVSRAMKAVEGAILLVDATQGVEAQTLSVLDIARKQNLVIVPALSKVDAPAARVDEVRYEVADLIGCDPDDVLLTSGKTGAGVPELLNTIIEKVPAPESPEGADLRALVFDFQYSDHRGVIVYARIFDGEVKARDELRFCSVKNPFVAGEVGILQPTEKATGVLRAGEIGYITTGVKEPGIAAVGDTIVRKGSGAEPLGGYQKPSPVIWASLYPESESAARSSDAFAALRQGLERLSLSDSSLTWEEEQSGVLGRGFRCGFLGMLHLEIVTERLKREFGLTLITTAPSVAYTIQKPGGATERVYTPAKFPEIMPNMKVLEPWISLEILVPPDLVGSVVQLLAAHEALVGETETTLGGRVRIMSEMPLRELMRNFFDKLTSATSGYASVAYEPIGEREADVTRMDVLVAEEAVPAFARVTSARRIEEEARAVVEKLKDVLPKQQFVLKIQAKARGRIIASERIAARRKDVTGYLYGGDVTRKMKLLEKQKKGKKKLEALGKGRVHIPQEVFLKMMREQ